MNLELFKKHSLIIVLFLLITLLAAFEDSARELLRYDVDKMELQHQWWRLLTANFVHTNWIHWALNSLGLILVWWIFHLQLKPLAWALFLLLLGPSHLYLLYWFVPTMGWYVGFSGVLHGWLAGAAIFDLRGHYWVGWLLLGGLIAKVIWEQIYGSSTGVGDLIAAHVATEAHLAGVVCGTLLALLWPDQWIVSIKHRDDCPH